MNLNPALLIPNWVHERIRAAGGHLSPRYEAAMYGPINSFLGCYYPVTVGFMVKPQGKIRPEHVTDIREEELARVSIDSYGGEVLSRDQRGGEKGVLVPDFIVVKATSSLYMDRVLLIVEIKRHDESPLVAHEQLLAYMEAFADKTKYFDGGKLFEQLYGMLVMGNQASLFTVKHNEEAVITIFHDMNSVEVQQFLRDIAIRNWL
ncbi:hypothetical protein BYT27DRAFT_7128975 [Phlegmacium glaucopus]|nr:hypothetical protein BYT27DRAFT_7128975 [Phlegmacium glaucopus]